MLEEEYNKKHRFYKYLCMFFATLIGAFLAVYFVTDVAINRAMNPYHMMRKMDREFSKIEKDMKFMDNISHQKIGQMGIVDFSKTSDGYKFIIDLKPFDNNPNNINITTNDSSITLAGEAVVDKKNTETFTSFSQTYSLDENANIEKMTKKQVRDKLIITVPMEENE